MNTIVFFTPTFNRRYKKYQKKYQSLDTDLNLFIETIGNNIPVNLGGGIYKYRLSVKSKSKGKSGGFRIVTFELIVTESDKEVTLLVIYDKGELASISKSKILEILKKEGLL